MPRIPPLTERGLTYAWNQLLVRAGASEMQTGRPFSCGGVELLYQNPDDVETREGCLVVAPCENAAWRDLLERPQDSLTKIPLGKAIPRGVHFPFDDPVPILFWGSNRREVDLPFVELRSRNMVVFHADIVAATFFMLSRWEEVMTLDRDEHGRFPAHASVALRQRFLGRPLVDEYAVIMGVWLDAIAPGSAPRRSRFSVRLTHDIDHVRTSARSVAAELLRKPRFQSVARGLRHLGVGSRDPCVRACYELAEISERHGFVSSFYFKASARGPFDSGYNPNSKVVRRCVRELVRRGHEVGFHPGYRTLEDFEAFLDEKARLDAVLGTGARGGRQHYLRFNVGSTWSFWEAAGLSYDSTVGYPDHEGFRCGTSHPYTPFSIEEDRQYRLVEVPLIAMDTTLRGYRRLGPEQAHVPILELARRCKHVGGVFTLLWHNSSAAGTWEAWFDTYRRVVGGLSEMVAPD